MAYIHTTQAEHSTEPPRASILDRLAATRRFHTLGRQRPLHKGIHTQMDRV